VHRCRNDTAPVGASSLTSLEITMRTIRRPASLRWANARSAVGLGGCGLRLADLDQTDGVLDD
jgi:hypothetical protein